MDINTKKFISSIVALGAISVLLILPCLASEAENTLYKIELDNKNYKTVIIKLYTEKKYSILPSPIKKTHTSYALFLPETEKRLKADPSLGHLDGIVEDVQVEYFPLLSEDKGYTKISVDTANDEVELFVENKIYVTPKPKPQTAPVVKKQAQIKQPLREKIITPEVVKEKIKIVTEIKEIIKEVKVKDYTPAVVIALLLLLINAVWFVLRKKSKSLYDGKLSEGLMKKTGQLKSNETLLVFSKNNDLIERIKEKCSRSGVNLYVPSDSEFRFDEFYKHRDFYKNLNPKPSGVIFDIDPKGDKESKSKKFDFVKLKKYIDLNFTNIFLILDLIIKDFQNTGGFIIFTDSNNKIIRNNLVKSVYSSTNDGLANIIKDLKQNQKVYYYSNDLTGNG